MAIIAMFYGIIVSMYYFDIERYHLPHIHVRSGNWPARVRMPFVLIH
jgi:hypothetical protein